MDANKLLKSIHEDATLGDPKVGPVDGVLASDDVDHWPHEALTNPEMFNRVNAWLAMLTQRPYVNPFSALQYLKLKLQIGGIYFKDPKFIGEIGSESVPLHQWSKPTDFHIVFDWVVVKGWYTISAEIKGAPKEAITESAESPEFHQMCEAASAHGYSLLSVLGNGSRVYTHTQGIKLHIKQHALKGASFNLETSHDAKNSRSGFGTNALAKHLAFIHGRSHGYKGKYEFSH